MLLETKYQQVWTEDGILVFMWLPQTRSMHESEYIEEIKKAARIIEEQKKKLVLLLAKELHFVISIPLQREANEILLPVYNNSGVEKLAVVVPQDMIATLSVSQTIEEQRALHKFQTRFFSDEAEAREWLTGQS